MIKDNHKSLQYNVRHIIDHNSKIAVFMDYLEKMQLKIGEGSELLMQAWLEGWECSEQNEKELKT